MTEKVVTMVVCDFPHKHDIPAVSQVTIDVCTTHAQVLNAEENKVTCPDCGESFSRKGIATHRTKTHGILSETRAAKDSRRKRAAAK